eukprot:CAMPEP_0183393164 /NCGR_PEP_ID=MMETSP0370-20130417/7759_1 /TAXON_ID=268820 /ORGANISM="Peridinium aciculiferum, Strain PAER-2" /LENGTH=88 /DNA_ID=CAMNT_0025573325 /DNA_START=365 /DNA_END=631 /DNA_ORIENTATION=+
MASSSPGGSEPSWSLYLSSCLPAPPTAAAATAAPPPPALPPPPAFLAAFAGRPSAAARAGAPADFFPLAELSGAEPSSATNALCSGSA